MAVENSSVGKGDPKSGSEQVGRRITLREADLQSDEDMMIFCRLLTTPANRDHFSNPPKDPKELRTKLERDGTKVYFGKDFAGRIVGAGGINDAEEGQHDHWLVKVAMDPKYQGKGLGAELVSELTEKAFTTKDRYGRDRKKISAAVIVGVPGSERMPVILGRLGFRLVGDLQEQVDVTVSSGRIFTMPTRRYELTRSTWEFERVRRSQ